MFTLIKNNVRLLLARKGTLFMLLILPIALVGFGLMLDMDGTDHLKLGVIDSDQTDISASLISELESMGNRASLISQEEAEDRLIDGTYTAVLKIPDGLEASLLAGRPQAVSLMSLQGQEITGVTKAQLNQYLNMLGSLHQMNPTMSGAQLVDLKQSISQTGYHFSIDRSASSVHRGLGLAGGFMIYLISLNMLRVGQLILKEKAWFTQNRIQRSPVSRLQYLMANVLTGLVFLAVNLISLYVLATFVFHIQTTPEMYLIWLVFGLVWIAIGIWLAMIVPSTLVHSTVSPILTTIGAMLGGSFWPLYLMPDFMQKLAAITPHYWANLWLESVQKGVGLLQDPKYLVALLGFLLLFFSLGLFSLARKRQSQSFI